MVLKSEITLGLLEASSLLSLMLPLLLLHCEPCFETAASPQEIQSPRECWRNIEDLGLSWEDALLQQSALCYLVSSPKTSLLLTSICPTPRVLIFHFIMHSFSLSAILPCAVAP